MTDREIMQQALEAILAARESELLHPKPFQNRYLDIIGKLEAQLAQPEQEPVGWFDWDATQQLWVQVYPNTHGQPLYTALAQPEQEPVAWIGEGGKLLSFKNVPMPKNIPVYAAPPKPEQESISTNDHLCAMLRQVHDVLACTALPMKRKWVGLTDEEINDFDKKLRDNGDYCSLHFAWGISAKLKEKNNAV
jgi:hypothetical protein